MVEEKGFEVSVGVVFAGLVVLVIGALGGELFEPLADVFDEAALVVIDVDGGGDVHGRDEAEAVTDAAAADDGLDLVSDVDHLFALAGVEGEVFGVGFHKTSVSVEGGFRSGRGGSGRQAFLLVGPGGLLRLCGQRR